ncbi:MAG TPA: class I SAM-dependent methyltransferase, partial [Balneolaceae bacterium]|nr:class I SAM-dependent methyltransferase [Balneolaceae bacterium]
TGRFPIGLMRLAGPVNYTGLDVRLSSIQWCKRYIERRNPDYHFEHIDVANARSNKTGKQIEENFRFNVDDESIDIICLFGVFTNVEADVVRIYLHEMNRILAGGGKVYFTAFVEENVPDVAINPEGYLFDEFIGPLNVVRFEKNYIFSLISDAGLILDEFIYGTEFDGQSEFYLSKPTN